jgi:hypothetical protein
MNQITVTNLKAHLRMPYNLNDNLLLTVAALDFSPGQ